MWVFSSVLCCQKYLFSEDEIHEVDVNITILGHANGVCQLHDICLSSRFEYYSLFYGGAHEVLDAFQLLKEQQLLQFNMMVVPCPAVVFPLYFFAKKGKIWSPRYIRGAQNLWDSGGAMGHVLPWCYATQENKNFSCNKCKTRSSG